MGGIADTKTVSLTLFGREVFRIENKRDFGGGGGPERGGSRGVPKKKDENEILPIKTDLIVPLVTEVMAGLRPFTPDLIGNNDDSVLPVEKGIDSDEACRILRDEMKLSPEKVAHVVFQTGAQTNLYGVENRELARMFESNVREVINKHWYPEKTNTTVA